MNMRGQKVCFFLLYEAYDSTEQGRYATGVHIKRGETEFVHQTLMLTRKNISVFLAVRKRSNY